MTHLTSRSWTEHCGHKEIHPTGDEDGALVIADIDPEGYMAESERIETANLIAAAPDLLAALQELREQLRAHVKMDVKKYYSLMVADVAADKAIAKAEGR